MKTQTTTVNNLYSSMDYITESGDYITENGSGVLMPGSVGVGNASVVVGTAVVWRNMNNAPQLTGDLSIISYTNEGYPIILVNGPGTIGRSGPSLSDFQEGTLIKIRESGTLVDFYVAKHDYESNLNGAGRTLVVRKDVYGNRAWDKGNVNAYASSDLDSWFNSTYKNMLDADIRSLIGTTKIRYTPGNGNWTVGTLERAVFALSATELGQSASWFNVEGSALPIANTLIFAYLNGSANTQWTRSPYMDNFSGAILLTSSASVGNTRCNYSHGSRPAFTLPADLPVDPDTMEVIA